MNSIISPTKSVTVLRRLIIDNTLIIFDVNHYIGGRTRGVVGYMALKLDVSRACDRIERSLLYKILVRLDFS